MSYQVSFGHALTSTDFQGVDPRTRRHGAHGTSNPVRAPSVHGVPRHDPRQRNLLGSSGRGLGFMVRSACLYSEPPSARARRPTCTPILFQEQAMPRFAILEAPSPLGLGPTGVEQLPSALLHAGLLEGLRATHAGRVEPPPHDPQRDPETRILNVNGVRAYAS